MSDTQITDLSWANLGSAELIARLKAVKDVRDVAALGGKHWSRVYVEGYIDMLERGGELEILPFIGRDLLYVCLAKAPIFANVSGNILDKHGRTKNQNALTHTSAPDDINGRTFTHSIVIHGNDEDGNFLVADPWEGLRVVGPEHMVLSIAGAQIECDNQIFQIFD